MTQLFFLSILALFSLNHAESKELNEQVSQQLKERFELFANEIYCDNHSECTFEILWKHDLGDLHAHPWRKQNTKNIGFNLGAGWKVAKWASQDVLDLVMCHELGHLFGGEPLKHKLKYSVEGQADYFSSHECLGKLWAYDLKNNTTVLRIENVIEFKHVPHEFKTNCEKHFAPKEDEVVICKRTLEAAFLLTQFINNQVPVVWRKPLSFFTPDEHDRGPFLLEGHPSPQCRLDTFYAGVFSLKRPRCWIGSRQ